MGDYAITKIIVKVKPAFQEKLKNFIEKNKLAEHSEQYLTENDYSLFWESVGITPFYYQKEVFGRGTNHGYETPLGTSEDHEGSDFYIDEHFTTRFVDGLWFVEFSSKVSKHKDFIENVVPLIADAWLGLYGQEGKFKPEKLSYNDELIVSNDSETQEIILGFRDEYAEEYEDPQISHWPW